MHRFKGFLIALIRIFGSRLDGQQSLLQGIDFRSASQRNFLGNLRGKLVGLLCQHLLHGTVCRSFSNLTCRLVGNGLLFFQTVKQLVDRPFNGFERIELLFSAVDAAGNISEFLLNFHGRTAGTTRHGFVEFVVKFGQAPFNLGDLWQVAVLGQGLGLRLFQTLGDLDNPPVHLVNGLHVGALGHAG